MIGAARRRATTVALVASSLIAATPLSAQLRPDADWRTLRTAHFYIHFTPPLEGQARRAAVNAERAWANLATELVPPRAPVDLVLSDDADFSNGSATPFPTNRIVIYANPPADESELRFTDDWNAMVITHELTHIFHLDRSRGVWALAQHVFGRAPGLFPNQYSPSWLTEGLAVYYESRFTGAGRIAGSEHRAIARAAAIDHRFPAIGSVSLATSRFPFGESAYAYGSLFIDWLARTRGASRVGSFVEKSSAELIPVWLDLPARSGFGISFSRAWRLWSDSLRRSLDSAHVAPLPDWRDLTRDGVFAEAPRWVGDSAIVYSGTPGRESYGAYRVDVDGRRERIGRRNGRSANVALADGSLLYSQLEFVGPNEVRSDLWTQSPGHTTRFLGLPVWGHGGVERRLTRGARLAVPDARSDGAIVAMQIVPAGTRLVRVSADGARITPLTAGGIDEQWTEPRWSHRGDRIAAVRWLYGGISQIVVLDTTGRVLDVVASGHAVQASPSWLPDDRGVAYTSDRTGTAEVYVRAVGAGAGAEYRVSTAVTGLFEPQFSPDGASGPLTVAGVLLRGDGYHVGIGECCADSAAAPIAQTGTRAVPAPAVDSSAARRYAPLRQLAPRYWLPFTGSAAGGETIYGASTSAADVVGRHAWSAYAGLPADARYLVAGALYEYAGLGLPIVQLTASQDFEDAASIVRQTGQVVGTLQRRVQAADVAGVWVRRRVRTFASLAAGAGVERHSYGTDPSGIALRDSARLFGPASFPRLLLAMSWANTQRPPFSISPEDGVSVGVTGRERLHSGFAARAGGSASVVALGRAYKSLPFPGFAHHVLSLRASGAWTDLRADDYFEIGGISSSVIEVIPGYTVGQGGRDFAVRGFPAASLVGVRAVGGSAEYRVPLFAPARGIGLLPFFFDRSSLALFGDAGSAWCPSAAADRQVCTDASLTTRHTIASVGAELAVEASVLAWDAPYRLRLGVAHPVSGQALVGAKAISLYGAVGFAF